MTLTEALRKARKLGDLSFELLLKATNDSDSGYILYKISKTPVFSSDRLHFIQFLGMVMRLNINNPFTELLPLTEFEDLANAIPFTSLATKKHLEKISPLAQDFILSKPNVIADILTQAYLSEPSDHIKCAYNFLTSGKVSAVCKTCPFNCSVKLLVDPVSLS